MCVNASVFSSGETFVCPIPLFTVLPHAHSSAVSRGRVAAGALANLKADATAGAAWRPGGPRGPRSVSMETQSLIRNSHLGL